MEKMPHALIHLTAARSFGSKLDGTLKIVTYHTNSVKKEFTHGFGKSQIKGGANAPDYDPTHSNSPATETFSRSLSFLGEYLVDAAFQVKMRLK